MVRDNSDVLYIDGSIPTTIRGYEFDIELRENAKPFSAMAPRLSLEKQRKEQYHIKKAMEMGHLTTPTPAELGQWTALAHVVYKKDDPMGRMIVDFRMLNKSTIAQPISLQNVQDKVRRLAHYHYKAMFDAVYGFNQISASATARKILQIQTSLGIKQYTVLPFGVVNGPSLFQGMMLEVFQDEMAGSLSKHDSNLDIHMDDGSLGSGTSGDDDLDFQNHLNALTAVFATARKSGLKS